MNPEQLIEFIRSQLIAGKSRPEIEQILRINNVSEKEAAIAFNAAEWQKNQNIPLSTHRARKSHPVVTTILVLILLICIVGTYITIYQPNLLNQWLSNNPTPVPETPAVVETPPEPAPIDLAPVVIDETATTTATSTTPSATSTPEIF